MVWCPTWSKNLGLVSTVAAAGGFCLPFSNYDTEVAEAGHGLEESTFRSIVDFQAEGNFKINS